MFASLLVSIVALTAQPEPMQWTFDGVERGAGRCAAESPRERRPLVFVFHGHGGNMNNAARSFHLHELWPEAIVVYPQGLPTPSRIDPQGKRSGWQQSSGTQQDRDLKLFDTMLASVKKKWHVDENQIYATGHSNGAIFTYLLWAAHPDLFAAVAPSSRRKVALN